MSKADWFFGCMAVIGLAALIAFEWVPGLIIFAIGGLYMVANGASVRSS